MLDLRKPGPRPISGNPMRRVLRSPQPDHEYTASCEDDAARYKQALQDILILFTAGYVDGAAVKRIASEALTNP